MIGVLRDNPILVMCARSRLRRQHVVPFVTVILVLCAFIALSVAMSSGRPADRALSFFRWFATLQGAVLLLLGTARVGAATSQVSQSGMLDFHRVSPLSARSQAVGFVLGAPIREYLGFAIILPLTLVAGCVSQVGLLAVLGVCGLTLLSSWVFHTLAAVLGLFAGPGARRVGTGGGVGFAVVACLLAPAAYFGTALPGLLTPIPGSSALLIDAAGGWPEGELPASFPQPPTFFGLPLPLYFQSLIYQVPVLAFLSVALVRRLRSDGVHLFSRPVACLLLGTVATLALGGVIGRERATTTQLGAVSAVVLGMAWLLVFVVTPTAGAHAGGLRRAARRGQEREPAMADAAVNWRPVACFAGIVAAVAVGAEGVGQGASGLSRAASTGLSVLWFGWALQGYALLYRGRAVPYFMLLLFGLCAVPLLLAILLASADLDRLANVAVAVCPFGAGFQPDPMAIIVHAGLALWFGLRLRTDELDAVGRCRDATVVQTT
ncbi:MAG: hypothetical protein AAF628_16330 [Planctomycetota bacterium]